MNKKETPARVAGAQKNYVSPKKNNARNPKISQSELIARARAILAEYDLVPSDVLDCSGNWARCGTSDNPKGGAGSYKIFMDYPPYIIFSNFKNGPIGNAEVLLNKDEQDALTPEERKALEERIRQDKEKAAAELAEKRKQAAKTAAWLMKSCPPAGPDNPYLAGKGLEPLGDLHELQDGTLVMPLLDAGGNLVSAQKIMPDGGKRFLKGGPKAGCYFPIPARDCGKAGPLLIGEGLATVLACCHATGHAGLVALDAGNLGPVARLAREKYPARAIVLCADYDDPMPPAYPDVGGIGRAAAAAAAEAIGGKLAVSPAIDGGKSDFADHWARDDRLRIKRVIDEALSGQALSLPEKLPEPKSGLRCLNVADFISKEYPPREMLLSPVFAAQSITMVFAMRGLGKTYFSLSVALAVAGGGKLFDRWEAFRPARVLYIDGEMPAVTLQERISKIVEGADFDVTDADMLRIITPDEQDMPMPNLATKEGQEAVEPHLDGVELLILDNLATLARTGKANNEDYWAPIQGWFLSLRRRGISVLFVHHAGKNGSQRGTGAKEDAVDTVIELRRPADYTPSEGARFEVHFSKARGLLGNDTDPFELCLRNADCGGYEWHTRAVTQANMEKVKELCALGLSLREIADETGISKSQVQRMKNQLKGEGCKFSNGKN